MKILFVLHSHQAGGAERHVLQLMQGLRSQGVQCIYAGPKDSWLADQLAADGFRCEHIAYRGLYDLASHISLIRLIRREKADLIHAHMNRGAFYAGWAGRLTRTPWVVTAHSMDVAKRYESSSRIIAVSQAVHHSLLDSHYAASLIRTVHNGVPDYAAVPSQTTSQVRKDLGLDGFNVITMVARFDKIKGQDIALQALATLKNRSWILLLVGSLEPAWAGKMQQLAADLGIADRVRFYGHSDDVASLYACSDILIAPSRREALSLTLLEAVAFSLPIVASRVDGIVEAVADGESAFLIPVEDASALAENLCKLLDDASLRARMGRAGRLHYETHFSQSKMVQSMLSVYREALNGTREGIGSIDAAISSKHTA